VVLRVEKLEDTIKLLEEERIRILSGEEIARL